MCDKSGHTTFPFSNLAHLTLLTWLGLGSVSARDLLRLVAYILQTFLFKSNILQRQATIKRLPMHRAMDVSLPKELVTAGR